MNRLTAKALTILLMLLFVMAACDDRYKGVDYQKMAAEEKEILDAFYETSTAAWDSLKALSIDTIDKRDITGLMYLERVKGTGDSILIGKQVGVRFAYYALAFDNNNEPRLYPMYSNYDSEAPLTFVVGSPSNEVFTGVDLGVRYMRNLGKSTFIMPSSISSKTQYYTVVADVEVVFVEFD